MQVEQRALQRELAPYEQRKHGRTRHQGHEGRHDQMGDLAQSEHERPQAHQPQPDARKVGRARTARADVAHQEEPACHQGDGQRERGREQGLPPHVREHQARDQGRHCQPHGYGPAVQRQVHANVLLGRHGHDHACHGGIEKPRAHGLHQPAAEQREEVGRHERERASRNQSAGSHEEEPPQPQTAQQERRHHDGRGGHHGVPDDQPVRYRQRDPEPLGGLRQRDVHHVLHERCRKRARQKHRQHRRAAVRRLACPCVHVSALPVRAAAGRFVAPRPKAACASPTV